MSTWTTVDETTCLNSGGDAPAFPPSATSSPAEQKACELAEVPLDMPIGMGQCGHVEGTPAPASMDIAWSGAPAWWSCDTACEWSRVALACGLARESCPLSVAAMAKHGAAPMLRDAIANRRQTKRPSDARRRRRLTRMFVRRIIDSSKLSPLCAHPCYDRGAPAAFHG
jgi:hypothetical protein